MEKFLKKFLKIGIFFKKSSILSIESLQTQYMTLYLIYILIKKYILIINKWFIDNFIYNTRFSIIFSMFLVKNVDKNKWSSNRQKFKNAQLQFQKPGSYKKKKVYIYEGLEGFIFLCIAFATMRLKKVCRLIIILTDTLGNDYTFS